MDKQQEVELDRRLHNWAAWARSGIGGRFTCGSAERRYVAPRDDDETRADAICREPINVADAEVIERAVLKLQRHLDRELLKRFYVLNHDDKRLAAFLSCRPFMVRPHVLMALGSLQYVVDHLPLDGRITRGLHSRSASNMYQLPPTKDAMAP